MSNYDSSAWSRRDLLKTSAAASLSVVGSPLAARDIDADADVASKPLLIRRENEKSGTRDWQLTRVRINQGKYRTSLVEGYCSHQSIAAGEVLRIFVSTEPARQFTIDVYRMGYYGGTGARHVTTLGPLRGTVQEVTVHILGSSDGGACFEK